MPTLERHQSLIRHNTELINYLSDKDFEFRDWMATGLFYVAVHYVEGHFAKLGLGDSASHSDRRRRMCGDPVLDPIYSAYGKLCNRSRQARYDGDPPDQQAFRDELLPAMEKLQRALGASMGIPSTDFGQYFG